jgi:hypothetical protein
MERRVMVSPLPFRSVEDLPSLFRKIEEPTGVLYPVRHRFAGIPHPFLGGMPLGHLLSSFVYK